MHKTKVKKPILANKFLLWLCRTFYGKMYFRKYATLTSNASLSSLQPPYIVVTNHCGIADVFATEMLTKPLCASYIMSETQVNQWTKLVRHVGILTKKQFSVDVNLIKDIKYVLDCNRPVVIFPEAKISVDGRLLIIKKNIAKLVKMLKVPLVTIRFDGAYLNKPRWAKDKRFVPINATVNVAVTKQECDSITVEEIYDRIITNLTYDDYAWQKQNKIEINSKHLVEGLHTILYKCPCCGAEYQMSTKGNVIKCNNCGATVTQNCYGELIGGKFAGVTSWYDWQTDCVRQSLIDNTFSFCQQYDVEKLVNGKYVKLGQGTITLDENGITAQAGDITLNYPIGTFYTLSFNDQYVYLPTAQAVYRFGRIGNVGCNTKLNIALEQQTMLHEQTNKKAE